MMFLLAAVTGCVQEQDFHVDKGTWESPEGKVNIRCSVRLPDVVLTPEGGTKAMAETPTINTIHVAVFGSSGYMKEYVQASDVVPATENNQIKTFNIRLSLNDSRNLKAHVIVNGPSSIPFTDEVPAMRNYAYTTGNQDAYWCRIELPDGIQAKREWVDSLQMYDFVKDQYGDYQVTDDVTAAFTNLPLVRNFAKIMVTSATPQLVIDSMAIVSKPSSGSIAPYSDSLGRFVSEYKDSSYAGIQKIYKGCVPTNMTLTDTDPSKVRFTANPSTVGQFMYERPATTNNPTYLIVHGTYYPMEGDEVSSEGTPGYYKLDLSENGVYYAILRNFRYNIKINTVSKPGTNSPETAAGLGTGGDVSSSTTPDVLDISDGYGRIAVNYYQQTLIEQTNVVELKYKFLPDETEDVADNDAVTLTVNPGTNGNVISGTLSSEITGTYTGQTLSPTTNGAVFRNTADDAEGYRSIFFTTTSPDELNKKSQTIRITGVIPGTNTQIYREVTWFLMAPQTMYVSCTPSSVEDRMGEKTELKVAIPKELPESMFPLQFKIESSAKSLTPNRADYPDENLPVATSTSIAGGTTPTFHYVYTLDRETYNSLPDSEENGYVYFTSHFETNKDNSACTIYVANDYFKMDENSQTALGNYHRYNFYNVRFSNNHIHAANTPVNLSFQMDPEDGSSSTRTVKITLYGLEPAQGSPLTQAYGESEDVFNYEMTGTSANLALMTADASGVYGVKLECLDGTGFEVYRPSTMWNYENPWYYALKTEGITTYGWTASNVNPDSNTFDSYQSNNYHVGGSLATMRITVAYYTEFNVYIRSYAEGSYDYVVVRKLDAPAFTEWTYGSAYSDSNTKASTRGSQQSGTALSNYTLVTFNTDDGLTDDGTQHTFYIQYGKDNTQDSNDDRGYVLIPKEYGINTDVTVVLYADATMELNNSTGYNYTNGTNYSAGLANVRFTNSSGYRTGRLSYTYYGRYIGTDSADGTIVVSAPSGYPNFTITKIEYTFYQYEQTATASVSGGSGTTTTNNKVVTWTGTATGSVTLSMARGNNTNKRNVIQSVKVYYHYDD